jgi:hypothetical protein
MMPFAALRMRAVGGGGGGTTYLDSLATTPHLVLSLRKMISTATVAIRVRRSSDNTEQDIGFSGNSLDTASLATFVGAGNGFVVTFYDQTGNGRNAVQATAAKQPRIVSSGTYDGKLVFDGSDDAMTIPSLNPASQYFGLYTKIKLTTAGSFKIMFEHGPDGATTAGGMVLYGVNNSTQWEMTMANGGAGSARAVRYPVSLASLERITALYNRATTGVGENRLWRSGSEPTRTDPATVEQTGNFSSQTLHIGARTATSLYADMWLETLAIYNADSESLRTSIEAIVA